MVSKEGGWDANLNWEDILSLEEQQRLGMARLFFHTPKFGILDECTNATGVNVEEQLYRLAKDLGITLDSEIEEMAVNQTTALKPSATLPTLAHLAFAITLLSLFSLSLKVMPGMENEGSNLSRAEEQANEAFKDDPQELEKYSDDNKELAWMFFVDGCAILQAVYMRYGNDDDDGKIHRENGEKFMNMIQRFIDDTVINPGEDRAKYENVSNVMLDMFTSRKIKSEMFEALAFSNVLASKRKLQGNKQFKFAH
ncbi:hypothetical protein GOBAR_AA20820 [Gossypium barbadense]|uniref:Uncharacterized protein n=1 Tax=Gossypium barbadense TaxID=3634 RepID=A0A2P5X926_GOSBA|nr:hypothetical protein GOBAR_AA20820 [Gossypium barbadense]